MVGVNTVRRDDPSLTTRINGFHGKDPQRYILDTHLSISEDARVLQGGAATDTTVVTGPVVPGEKKRRLEEKGVCILSSPLKEGRIDLEATAPVPEWRAKGEVEIECSVRTTHKTGVEMEALTGATAAALTIYDMCKALTHGIRIEDVVLVEKTGGKRDYRIEGA